MKNNILFVNLPCHSTLKDFVENDFQYNPALGLLALTEYIELFGFNCYVRDFNYQEIMYHKIFDLIEEKGITVVAVTTYTENYHMMFKFMRMIKAYNPELITISGGPHATLRGTDLIKNRNIDYVISRDGETTITELIAYLEYGSSLIDLDDIEGLIYRRSNQVEINPERPQVSDLDLLPIINRERVDIGQYRDIISVYTSKGCPANCIYCSAASISGSRYRMRCVESVFLEGWVIYHQLPNKQSKLYFIDDTFTVNKRRVQQYVELYHKYQFPMPWSCESRVDVMTEELADLIGTSNCFSIQFGVESGDQEVLDQIRKNINLDHLIKMVNYIKQYPVGIFLSFMIGHFCDTPESVSRTIQLAKSLSQSSSNITYGVSINTPFPGTWQYEHAEEIGLEIIENDFSKFNLTTPVIRTKYLSEQQLNDFYLEANNRV